MVEFCAVDVGRLGNVDTFKRGWGGDTSNFAVAAARTGSKAAHICSLGDDEFGRSFLDLWNREGMDTSQVKVESGTWTGIYIISLLEGGGHDFTYYRAGSAASRYSKEDLNEDYIANAKVCHTSGISLAVSENLREACLFAMNLCRENGGITSFDVNMRVKLWQVDAAKRHFETAFRISDIVFASLEDMNTLYGYTDADKALDKLRGFGVDTAIIKEGSKGCYVSSQNERFRSPSYKIIPVDTTGSGDAFDGAWITATIEGWDLHKRADFSNAVGAITATGLGAVAPIPDRKQALKLIKEQEKK
jgi:2-dehydro-3-deoxygluconokinase